MGQDFLEIQFKKSCPFLYTIYTMCLVWNLWYDPTQQLDLDFELILAVNLNPLCQCNFGK